jgi:hypothetical protein
VTGDLRRMHKEELYDLYPSPIKSRRMRCAGQVVRMGDR